MKDEEAKEPKSLKTWKRKMIRKVRSIYEDNVYGGFDGGGEADRMGEIGKI
jgi:hypothetical protein